MTLPVALVPVALSAVRSLILLHRKIGRIATLDELDNDVPIFLPEVPDNIIRHADDRRRMEEAFSTDTPARAALEARGLAGLFDQWRSDDTLSAERRRGLFFRFLAVFYEIEDAESAVALPARDDARGLDQFLVSSARLGQGSKGLQILRATAETLVDFLGEHATVFLERSSHKAVLSTVLREFAAETDLENDSPERIIRTLLGSVAVAATDKDQTISDKPLALLLFASLGQVRRDMGEDFTARIISRTGFDAVVSDWLTRVAQDEALVGLVADIRDLDATGYDPSRPETLPAELQPVYGVLSETLKVIGGRIGSADVLDREDAFRDIFGAVLTGLSDHSTAFLAQGLEGKEVMAQVLNATLVQLSGHPQVRQDAIAAPLFAAGIATLGAALPLIGKDAALSKAETVVRDLAQAVASDRFQAAMAGVAKDRGEQFADALVGELMDVLKTRAGLLTDDLGKHGQAVMQTLLEAAPELLDKGMSRARLVALFPDMVAMVHPADTPEGGFAAEVLPLILPLLDGRDDVHFDAEDAETIIRAYVEQFGTNRPVWQEIFDRGLFADVIGAIADGVKNAGMPTRLPPDIHADLISVALVATGRNALDLADLPADGDPGAMLRDIVRAETRRAIEKAAERLGRGAEARDLPPLARRLLDKLLAAAGDGAMTDADIKAFLDDQLTKLRG